MFATVILAGACMVRSITIWDAHDFPHGITLQAGERLELTRPDQILRADGYPDLEKIKALLCSNAPRS